MTHNQSDSNQPEKDQAPAQPATKKSSNLKEIFSGSATPSPTKSPAEVDAQTEAIGLPPSESATITSDAAGGTPSETAANPTGVGGSSVARPLPMNQLVLPVVPVREGILFPSTESVLTFGRNLSVNAIQNALKNQKMVVLVAQRKPTVDEPTPADLYTVGTLAVIERTLSADDQVSALVRGVGRVKILRYVRVTPTLLAQVIKLEDVYHRDEEQRALATHLQKKFRQAIHMGKPVEFLNFMKLMSGVTDGELVDQIASTLNSKTKDKQHILETLDVKERLRQVISHLSQEMKVLEIEKDVIHKTQEKFDKSMRENVLRERLRTIQKELGDIDDEEEVVQEYEKKLKKTKFSPVAREKVVKELKRLKQMSVNNPEAGYVRTWVDTMFELPWGELSKDTVDITKAEKILDEHHYGLKDVKDRILEYIAVLQLKKTTQAQAGVKTKASYAASPSSKTKPAGTAGAASSNSALQPNKVVPTILCFVGPPGVGKTSIGRSIAEAMGRTFVKISLGGIRDEAEIRGHRRTYVGAMTGRIINGMKQAKTMNPVFMLDEIDKIGSDFRGDPSAALLEALDPEQNNGFEDHYLDVPFDLSRVLFITTANTLETIPPALRDRLEIIRYSGYTQEEKFEIGNRYLWPKVLSSNGLKATQIQMEKALITTMVERYTREAGVRELERIFNKLTRKAARQLLSKKQNSLAITQPLLKEFLGPEEYDVTLTEESDQIGVATGLAWTSVGGDMLFIEVALTPGTGQIKLTGKLGDVMKESAQAALTYVKANAKKLDLKIEAINKTDIHIHVPEGAVPKDGPSAGITMTTAIVSAFTNRPVEREIAMTGEVTLRGRVLRIGGLKEKSIAAHRAGSKIVIIPKDNERDLIEIPDSVKAGIVFKPVAHMNEVLKLALKAKK